jgi:hypothetical protein
MQKLPASWAFADKSPPFSMHKNPEEVSPSSTNLRQITSCYPQMHVPRIQLFLRHSFATLERFVRRILGPSLNVTYLHKERVTMNDRLSAACIM